MLALSATPVLATSVPPSASADRMYQEHTGAAPDLIPPTLQNMEEAEHQAPQLPRPPHADKVSLTINTVELADVSVYKTEDLAPLWQGELGHPITLDQVYGIADRLTQRYRDDGYVLARAYIPQQEIGDTVKIAVAEGKIGEVRLEGDIKPNNLLNLALDQMRQQPALNIKTLENQLLLLGDLPGSSFRVVLQPGAEGTVDVVVVADKDPSVNGLVSFDNTGSRYLGPYMVSATLMLYNMPADFHQTTLSASTALQTNELALASVSHVLPLWRPDLLLTIDANYTKGNPGYTLENSDIESTSLQLGAHVDWEAIRQRTGSLTFTGGFTYRNSATDVLSVPFTEDHIRSIYAAVRYDWLDFMDGYNLAQLTLTHGLSGLLGGSQTGDSNLSRARGQADFTKAELSLMRTQPLWDDFTLFGALSGQLSNGPLLSSEEFGYGGAFIGRAYDVSEMTGDSGVSVLLELRYHQIELTDIGATLEPFVFVDYGAVFNRDIGQPARINGASLGFGGRFKLRHNIEAELTIAQPLIASHESTYSNRGGPRILFALRSRF